MPTTNIPDQHELLRHVKSAKLELDPNTLEPIGFLPEAFELRQGEDHLSASWVQFFAGPRRTAVEAAANEFANGFEIKRNDRFALGVVGAIKSTCSGQGVKVRIVHDGKGYASHAAVRQFNTATFELMALLATDAWSKMVAPSPAVLKTSKDAKRARSRQD
jgi:hypothetical protein